MDELSYKLESLKNGEIKNEPVIFDFKNEEDKKEVLKLLEEKKINWVSDDYAEQLKELFAVKNQEGKWVFYPWLGALSHILPEDDFFAVRTSRNKNLIIKEEQEKFYNSKIGIAGLSVGSSVALAIALEGGAKHMKLADFDSLALSNTNRVMAGVQNLGFSKAEIVARQIYELNPYAKVEIFKEGLNKNNIEKFFDGLDMIIDELDNASIKFLIRQEAKKHKIPVIMAADNGECGIIDIERYDLNPQPKFFHGRMGKISFEKLEKMDKRQTGKIFAKQIGLENISTRMVNSFMEIGKTIVSWPQLGGTAMLNGATVAYCARKIASGQPIKNRRGIISLDEKLMPFYIKEVIIQNVRAVVLKTLMFFGKVI